MDAWEEMVDTYGGQLADNAPGHLRVMLKNTLPKDIEDELQEKPELNTWEEIIEWCRAKLIYQNQKNLASYIKPTITKISQVKRQEDSFDEEEIVYAPRGRARRAPAAQGIDPELKELLIAAL